MKTLTKEQYDYIQMGMRMERAFDIRQHKGMPQETCNLYRRHIEATYLFPQNFDDLERDITYNALLNCYSFWREWAKDNLHRLATAEDKEAMAEAFRNWQPRRKKV